MPTENLQQLSTLLIERFGILELPSELREVAQFQKENFHGFFRGILENVDDDEVLRFLQALQDMPAIVHNPDYQSANAFRPIFEDFCFRHVIPFHKHLRLSITTPVASSEDLALPAADALPICVSRIANLRSPATSGNSTLSSLPRSKSSLQPKFRASLLAREKCCFFCWERRHVQAAHIPS